MKIIGLIIGILMLISINPKTPLSKNESNFLAIWIMCAISLIIISVVTYGK